VVEHPAAVERVRLAVPDLRSGSERGGPAHDGIRRAQLAGLHREADGVGKQVFDLIEFFRIGLERVRQYGKRLRQFAAVLPLQAAGECQWADEAVPDPFGVRGGGGEVPVRRVDLAAVEADDGGDTEVIARRIGFLQVLRISVPTWSARCRARPAVARASS